MGNSYEELKDFCPVCGRYKKESSLNNSIAGIKVCTACYKHWRELIGQFDSVNLDYFIDWIEKNAPMDIEIKVVKKPSE